MQKRAALFSHIQKNNLKTLALLALFLVLLIVSQIAILLVPVAMNMNILSRFEGVERSVERAGQRHDLSRPATRIESEVQSAPGQPKPKVGAGAQSGGLKPIDSESARLLEQVDPARTSRIQTMGTPDERRRSGGWHMLTEHPFLSRYWYLIIVAGLAYIALSCWKSVVLMRSETRAHPVERSEAPELFNLVENLAISIGLPCPRIEVIESDKLNAYAAGFFPSASTIAVTRGLIEQLTRDELEAVLAHEMVHIRDRDVRLMVMAHACVDRILPVSKAAVENMIKRPFLSAYAALLMLAYLGLGFALLFALLFGVIGALAIGARFAISQTREFTADAGAIELTKNPVALITALRKVARADDLALTGYASRAMMFSSADESFLGRLIGTHPPIAARIEAIKQHASVAEHELPPVRALSRAVPIEAPAQQPAFGRKRVVHGLSGQTPWAEPTIAVRSEPTGPWGTPPSSDVGMSTLGRRARNAALQSSDPGQRPISAPPVKQGTVAPAEASNSVADWLIGRKGDQVVDGINKAFMVPVRALAYFSASVGAFALVMSLMMVSPPIGLAAAALLAWYAWRNIKRGFAWLRQSLRAITS